MPYIGHGVTNAGTFYILDDLTMSSSATYTMQVGGVSVTPKADNLLITLDGVVQHTPDAYTVSGSTITFDSAPGSGVDFYGIIMGQSATIGQGSIGADELKVTGDGSSGQVLTSDGDGTFSWATDTENYLPLAGGTVTGDITLSGAKLLVADSAQGIFGANDGDTGIRWETNDVLAFDTQNAERLTIHADGQVKIAGSVANQQLYVEQDNTSNEAVRIIGPAATSATVAVLNVMTNNGASADTGLKVMQNGAVGIGLDTPEAPLHIVNSSNQLRLATDSTSGHAMLSHRSDDKFSIYSWDGSAYTDILLGVDGSSVGGRVGIGTNAPSIGLLDVRYTEVIPDGGSSNVDTTTVLNLKQEASNKTANIRFNTATANSAGHIIFNTDGSFQIRTDGSKYTTFKNSGDVQFGDSNGTGDLYHYGEGKFLINDVAGNPVTPTYSFNSDGDTGMYRHAANVIGFSTGETADVFIGSSGLYIAAYNGDNQIRVGQSGSGSTALAIGNRTITVHDASDERKKDIIGNTSRGLSDVLKWSIKDFTWKPEWDRDSTTIQTGAIAQEIIKVNPELVNKHEIEDENGVMQDGVWGIEWIRTIPYMVKAIQELSAEVEKLKGD